MILLKDNRGLIEFKSRLNIAVIDTMPTGEYSVEITEDWHRRPSSPHPEVPIESLFPHDMMSPHILRAWIEGCGMKGRLYLSVFDNVVKEMNALYKEYDYNKRMGLWQN